MHKSSNSLEDNSELLIRGDDEQIHQMQIKNQEISEKESSDEEIIYLDKEKYKLTTKCEVFEIKTWELDGQGADLGSKPKSYEKEKHLQWNYKTQTNKNGELAMKNQTNEEKLQHLEGVLKDLIIRHKICRVRNQRLDNRIKENAKKFESYERIIQDLQLQNSQWGKKSTFCTKELLKFKADVSELTTLAFSLNKIIQEKHKNNLHLAMNLENHETKVKQLQEMKDGMAMENKKNKEYIQQLEEKMKELTLKYENCQVRNQQLDNHMKEQARKCEDLEREIQLLMKNGKTQKASATEAEYYEKKGQELEEANQIERSSQKELLFERKISQVEGNKKTLAKTNECNKTMVQLLKQEMKNMVEKEECIEMKLDLLEMQNGELKRICQRLLKRKTKKRSPWSLFKRNTKKEERQTKESKVEMEADREGEKKKKKEEGGFLNYIIGLCNSETLD